MDHIVMCNQIWDLWIYPLYTFEIYGSMLYNDDGFPVNIKYNDHLEFYTNIAHLFHIFKIMDGWTYHQYYVLLNVLI